MNSGHSFYIPVMGTGFTLDTPLYVARYGISSVISLVDDVLIERLRLYHSSLNNEHYEAIPETHNDCRAKRITEYLNLLQRLVNKQVDALINSKFESDSEITRYFSLLPPTQVKKMYQEMLNTTDFIAKSSMESVLREQVCAGSIDVNIMTKLDCPHYYNGKRLPAEYNDAMSALRGYANSTLNSSVVFSAGLNQQLYSYASTFPDFLPNRFGGINKKIILKVSDYRSAAIQGKFLAKHGLWVSEYRIESGLNCGGHAFPCNGKLLGPILDEILHNKDTLIEKLWQYCIDAWGARKNKCPI